MSVKFKRPSKGYKNKRYFPYLTNELVKWLKKSGEKDQSGNYIVKDHSGIILVIGKRRSGKGVTSYSIVQQLQKFDPDRVLAVWKGSPKIVPYLNSHGIKAINVEEFKDLPYNSIWFIDEGILNLNAKKALTKFARAIDEIISIISHKRIIMIITFQRWQVFTSLAEQADCTIYKRLGTKMTNRARNDPFLKANAKFINNLPKNIGLIESDLDGFEGTGLINISLPKFYGPELSESYKDVNLDFDLNNDIKRNETIDHVALELLNAGYRPDPSDKTTYHALMSLIRKDYVDYKFKSSERNDVIQSMYRIMKWESHLIGDESNESDSDNVENFDIGTSIAKIQNITKLDLDITNEFSTGKSSTEFQNFQGQKFTKKKVMEIVRKSIQFLLHQYYTKVRSDKEGNKYERLIANHYIIDRGEYCIRALASGGKHGKFTIEPDMIHFTKSGEIRIVQIKVRKTSNFTFKPGTFETELEIVKILEQNPYFEGRVSAWLYFMKKGDKFDRLLEVVIPEDRNSNYLYVDSASQFSEFRKPTKKEKEALESKEKVKIAKKDTIKLKKNDEKISIKEKDSNKKIKTDKSKLSLKNTENLKIK